jgi:hypothetical protein
MAYRVNTAWLERQVENFTSTSNGGFYQVTVSGNPEAKALIARLSDRQIAFAVVNLGAGVKLITNQLDVCPKCHGTGKVHKKE